MITRQQIKMGRAALGWSVRDLAAKSGVSINAITRFENGSDAYATTLTKLQRALEAGGVLFIDENGGGAGVRLKRRSRLP
jgi:transcriptional regulator with XRE-family HTH domain